LKVTELRTVGDVVQTRPEGVGDDAILPTVRKNAWYNRTHDLVDGDEVIVNVGELNTYDDSASVEKA
jgi:hypothetical protein